MPAAEIAEAGKRLKLLNDELGALEERWLALSEELDALQTQSSGG
jgi:ATP-binding cassette subfamily F protein 3